MSESNLSATPDFSGRTVYRFGEGCPMGADGRPLYSWPYTLHYTPGRPEGEFYAAEGDGRNGNGTFLSAGRLLEPMWRTHLERTAALWLVPLLERRAAGETIAPEQYLAAYQAAQGQLPPAEQWPVG